jgi:hypothetical protein
METYENKPNPEWLVNVVFPVEWQFAGQDGIGGPPVKDAGTIYILRDEDQYATMFVRKTSLNRMVCSCLDGWEGDDGYTEDCYVPASDALAAALRAAADTLDAGKRPNILDNGTYAADSQGDSQ